MCPVSTIVTMAVTHFGRLTALPMLPNLLITFEINNTKTAKSFHLIYG